MNHEHHAEELRMKLKHMEEQPAQNWLGKWAKSIQVSKIKNKIRELEKQIKKNKND